jgi:hypothetical protein
MIESFLEIKGLEVRLWWGLNAATTEVKDRSTNNVESRFIILDFYLKEYLKNANQEICEFKVQVNGDQ